MCEQAQSISRVLYIAGHGHSGTTLLNLLLGNHPQSVSVGEVERLSLYGTTSKLNRKCACGEYVFECPFWTRIAISIQAQLLMDSIVNLKDFWHKFPTTQYIPKSLVTNRFHLLEFILTLGNESVFKALSQLSPYIRQYQASVMNCWMVFDTINSIYKSAFIVDSSKNPTRLKLLYLTRPNSFWVIHLVRDGRAIVASNKRRENCPVELSAADWVRRYRNVMLVTRSIPAERYYLLRYEDLCTNPESELQALCAFVGVEYDSGMVLMREREMHEISPNPMIFDPSRRRQIRLDERWKNELSREELTSVDLTAGKLLRQLGYE